MPHDTTLGASSRPAILAATVNGLAAIRTRAPRVHGLTNTVAQAFTANILLAVGAVPTMTGNAEEAGDFVTAADALYVNLGTMDPARRAGIDVALDAALREGRPWVLDPAHCEASARRTAYARGLLARSPTLVRLNAVERDALGLTRSDADMVLTGAKDVVSVSGHQTILANGHVLQARVTAMGCAETAIIAALLAVGHAPFQAAVAGITALNVAAELAARGSSGPGTFAVNLLDCLYALREEDIRERLRLV